MSLLRQARTWTATIVIGLSAIAVQQGATVLSFGLTEALSHGNAERNKLSSFSNSMPVAAFARHDVIRLREQASAVDAAEIESGLELRPLDGAGWLLLAQARLESRAGPEKISASLAISTLTSPNEAWLMMARARLALPLWTVLPPDSRRAVISDLVNGGFNRMSGEQVDGSHGAMLVSTQKVREEVRAMLLLSGRKGEPIVKAFGLDRPPVASSWSDADVGASPSAASPPANGLRSTAQ